MGVIRGKGGGVHSSSGRAVFDSVFSHMLYLIAFSVALADVGGEVVVLHRYRSRL